MKPYNQRPLRICYIDSNNKVIDQKKMLLEERLKTLGNISVQVIKSLDDPNFHPCDLVVIDANSVPSEDFAQWLHGLGNRVVKQGAIWVPALIIADLSFRGLRDIMLVAASMNWYFDVLSMDHIDSMPIRVANLLRIHDHLHELGRYQKTLSELKVQVDQLTADLEAQKANSTEVKV
jgi:hypothetical protein